MTRRTWLGLAVAAFIGKLKGKKMPVSLPLITPAPVILDSTNLPQPPYPMRGDPAVVVGSGKWMLPMDQPYRSAPLHSQYSIYARTPASGPFAELDGAHRPGHGNDAAWTYDATTDKIFTVTSTPAALSTTMYPFNCATELYETPSPATSTSEGEGFGVQFRQCVKLSNGDVLHLYMGTTGTGNI